MKMQKNKKHSSATNYVLRSACCSSGMTLIETVVWVAITTSAMLAIVTSVQYFYRTNNYAVEQAAAISSAQRGIESMVKTMREAAYSSEGAYPVIALATSSISFYADIDEDPFIEKVRYFIQEGSMMRGIVGPSGDPPTYTGTESVSSLSDYVRNTDQEVDAFQYYNASGTPMADLTKVGDMRFVQATIVVNVNPYRLPNQFTLRSTASLRNLR